MKLSKLLFKILSSKQEVKPIRILLLILIALSMIFINYQFPLVFGILLVYYCFFTAMLPYFENDIFWGDNEYQLLDLSKNEKIIVFYMQRWILNNHKMTIVFYSILLVGIAFFSKISSLGSMMMLLFSFFIQIFNCIYAKKNPKNITIKIMIELVILLTFTIIFLMNHLRAFSFVFTYESIEDLIKLILLMLTLSLYQILMTRINFKSMSFSKFNFDFLLKMMHPFTKKDFKIHIKDMLISYGSTLILIVMIISTTGQEKVEIVSYVYINIILVWGVFLSKQNGHYKVFLKDPFFSNTRIFTYKDNILIAKKRLMSLLKFSISFKIPVIIVLLIYYHNFSWLKLGILLLALISQSIQEIFILHYSEMNKIIHLSILRYIDGGIFTLLILIGQPVFTISYLLLKTIIYYLEYMEIRRRIEYDSHTIYNNFTF